MASETVTSKDNTDVIRIVYGTETGNCMMLAEEMEEKFNELGIPVKVEDTEEFDIDELPKIKTLLFLVSTFGGEKGAPPLMAEDLLEYLEGGDVPDLSGLQYSVLALGDTAYEDEYCQAGIDFDKAFAKHGAKRITDRVDCDVDYDEPFSLWLGNVLKALNIEG